MDADLPTVEEIMEAEPSIEMKRNGLACADGTARKETVHRIHLGDAREMQELGPEQHDRRYRSIWTEVRGREPQARAPGPFTGRRG
ncbi:MAG: hypothetical protein ACRELC_10565 [Gemmatimonadota bacterium]